MNSANDEASSASFLIKTIRPSTIRQKLLRSHLLVAGLGVCLLVASLFSTIWLRATTVHLAEARGASAYDSMRALSGLHRSEAALRAWVVGGDPTFRQQRDAAWNEEIRPAIEQWQSLSWDWAYEKRLRMEQLVDTLNQLQDGQWWVEEVARTPGNEPALDVFLRDIDPLETSIVTAVTELIDTATNLVEEPARISLLAKAADCRAMLTFSNAQFRDFVASGDPITRNEAWQAFLSASRHLDELSLGQELSRPEQKELVDFVRQELSALRHHVERVIVLRERDDWNVARYRLRTDVDPLARKADKLLTEVSRKEHALMLQEAEQATKISGAAIGISMLLIVAMIGVAWFLSDRGATRIAQPVRTLTSGLEEMAVGRHTASLPVTRDDELGQLTRAFNTLATARQGIEASRRKHAEVELLNLGRTLDESINEIYVFDARTLKFIYVNRGAQENLQYTMDELRALTPIDLQAAYTPETFSTIVAPLRSGDRAGIDFETSHLRKNGTVYPVEVHLQTSSFEQQDVFVAIVLDITKRKQAEEDIRRWAQVLTDSFDAIIIKDLTGNIVEVNAATERQYGWTRDELVGHSIKRLVPPEEHEQGDELMARCIRGEEVRSVEVSRVTKSGKVLPMLLTLSLLTDDDGQATGVATISKDISRRKAAEEELQIKEHAIHSAVTGVAFGNLDGTITYANPAFVKMFGYENESEIVGHMNTELASDASMIDQIMMDVITRGSWRGKDLARKKDGTAFPVELAVALMSDSNGEPFGLVATFIDDTQRKQTEEALRESEERFRLFMDHSPAVAWMKNQRGEYVYLSKTFEDRHGAPLEVWLGKTVHDMWPTEIADEFVRTDTMVLSTGRTYELVEETPNRDGSLGSWWSIKFPLTDLSGAQYIGGIGVDITKQRQAERALRENEDRLRAILNAAVDSIITIDFQGCIVGINSATERTFGYTPEELVGQNVNMLMPSPYRDEHDSYLTRYLNTREPSIIGIGREVLGRRKDGSVFPANLVVSKVEHLDLFTGIIRDITNEKRSQERLLQSERLAAIGEAMAGLVHESRNAMASVQAQLRMLSRRIADRPELAQFIDGALKSQFEVQTLFEEVRQWAAPKKLEIQSCHLGKLLRDAWEKLQPQRAGRNAELHERDYSMDLTCEADEFSLSQVFRNIFENALAACEDPVEVDAEYREVHAGGRPALRVTIRDNGTGLTAEQRKRMFEAFYTTKTHGTGLGMSIARRTLQAHQGDIELGPVSSHGAEFIVTIPRKQT